MKTLVTLVAAVCIFTTVASAGTISGRVTREVDGAPIANAWVAAGDFDSGDWVGGNYTDSDGYYAIHDLSAGRYRMSANDISGACVSEYYDDSRSREGATPVTVVADEETSGIDFALALAGTISGQVRWESDGTPMEDIWVIAYDFESGDAIASEYTGSDGSYVIGGLGAGVYRVYADGRSAGCMSKFYDDVESWDEATAIAVIAGEETSGIDFELVAAGRISGRVTCGADGAPIEDIMIVASDFDSGWWVDSTYTDANGEYALNVIYTGVFRVRADTQGTYYVDQYYDSAYQWEVATPVAVTAGEVTDDIDFGLVLGGAIAGRVTADADGTPLGDIWLDAYDCDTAAWLGGANSDAEGNYLISRLRPGTYHVWADAQGRPYAGEWYDNAVRWEEATVVSVAAEQETSGVDFGLGTGSTISGTVVDARSGLPVEGVEVGGWHDEMQLWRSDWTDAAGDYEIIGLAPGRVYVEVRVGVDSLYARMGGNVELGASLSGLDFALPPGAMLSGRVVDAETAEPIARVHVNHWSERYSIWQSAVSDEDGCFTLTHLPPGIAEIDVDSLDDPSRVWLSWPASLISLDEGQDAGGRVIALGEGVLVRGYVKDADGAPVAECEVNFDSSTYEDDTETDEDGYYEVYLPAGAYAASLDLDNQGVSVPVHFTVSPDDAFLDAPEIIAYSYGTAERISGTVVNPGGWGAGTPYITALEAGTTIAAETFNTVIGVGEAAISETGEFVIPILPPGNYDLYLTVDYWTEDDLGSFAVCGKALDVAAGMSGLVFSVELPDGALQGAVLNAAGRPVLAATVFVADAGGGLAGRAETDEGGLFAVPNLAAGTYTLTAMHPKYVPMQTIADVADGLVTTVDTFVLAFAGGKEASDLNGDGVTDAGDLAVLAEQWLTAGDVEANFDQAGAVDLADLARMADLWRWEAMWTLTGNVQ